MYGLVSVDNQPIEARWSSDAIWITDLITPRNPTVQLKYAEITQGIDSLDDRVTALWQYVSRQPYKEAIPTTLLVGGKSIHQDDTWLYPSETIAAARETNCANRSFVLASMLKNQYQYPGQVYCAIGRVKVGSIRGNHAWVVVETGGGTFIIETTQPNLTRAFVPVGMAPAYEPVLCFDENKVYTVGRGDDPGPFLNEHFGVCAIPFLKTYLCESCMNLEV